jgi:hypothetical protein
MANISNLHKPTKAIKTGASPLPLWVEASKVKKKLQPNEK